MREKWKYDGSFVNMAAGLTVVYAEIEALRKSPEHLRRFQELRRRVAEGDSIARDELAKFSWNEFGIDTFAIMHEIMRLMMEVPKEDWLIYQGIANGLRKKYEEERE